MATWVTIGGTNTTTAWVTRPSIAYTLNRCARFVTLTEKEGVAMSEHTGIQWCDATWNPVVGCTKVSQGCKNCYAKTLHDQRHKAFLAGKKIAPQYAQPFETVQLMPERLKQPLSWREPRRVFVNSVSDVFHEDVADEYLDMMFAVMALAQRHTFQILTKRPERMRDYLTSAAFPTNVGTSANLIMDRLKGRAYDDGISALTDLMLWFEDPNAQPGDRANAIKLQRPELPNVWLGVSVENQAAADERIPILLDTPAAIRFLSCEPLLGPIDLVPFLYDEVEGTTMPDFSSPRASNRGLSWVITGGESGAKARPCDVQWIRDIVDQCKAAGTAVFVKQMGKWIIGDHTGQGRTGFDTGFVVNRWLFPDGRVFVPPIIGARAHDRPDNAIAFGTCDNHGGNWIEWPADLRIREFPAEVAA